MGLKRIMKDTALKALRVDPDAEMKNDALSRLNAELRRDVLDLTQDH